MPQYPSFTENQIQAISGVLSNHLTQAKIGELLERRHFTDPGSGLAKPKRLAAAFLERQKRDDCGNAILDAIKEVADPVGFVNRNTEHEELLAELNLVLIHAGYRVDANGGLSVVERASTLAEADERAGRLRSELTRRKVHPDVLRFCRAELLQENYFHAVLEATKSVAEKLRVLSGCTSDGAKLVDEVLSLGSSGTPLVALNALRTPSERDEQTGLANLVKGMFGAFRNPVTHAPKVTWSIEEQDALDLMSLVSLIHRRLDDAVPVPQPTKPSS